MRQNHPRHFKTCRRLGATAKTLVQLVWDGAWASVLSCSGDLNVQVKLRNTALNKVTSTVEARLQRIKKERLFSVERLAVLTSDEDV